MHRRAWIDEDFAGLLALFALRFYLLMQVRKKGLMWLSFLSLSLFLLALLISLHPMVWVMEGHSGLHRPHIVSGVPRWFLSTNSPKAFGLPSVDLIGSTHLLALHSLRTGWPFVFAFHVPEE